MLKNVGISKAGVVIGARLWGIVLAIGGGCVAGTLVGFASTGQQGRSQATGPAIRRNRFAQRWLLAALLQNWPSADQATRLVQSERITNVAKETDSIQIVNRLTLKGQENVKTK